MLVDIGYRNLLAQAIRSALQSGATFQIWSGAVPASAASTPAGSLLVDGSVAGGSVTVDSATALLTIANLIDNAINQTGTPTFVRIVDDQFTAQFTAKMASNATGGIEVTITDQADAAATQLLANRAFTGSTAIQF